ncbi:hypothetical protein LTR17_014505 [Elasticomyces elasticus]|nr:hypothetical protein LTR17_014505 [Elasticomyces elasticus]
MEEAEIRNSVSFEPHATSPTGSEHDIHMDFSIDILEDVAAEVEAVMRLSAFGLFREARKAADDTLRRYLDNFPVAVEYLRLLHDQGDFEGLRQETDKFQRGEYRLEDALPGDIDMVLLLCDIRNLSSKWPLMEDLSRGLRQIDRIERPNLAKFEPSWASVKDDPYYAGHEGRQYLRGMMVEAVEQICAVRMSATSICTDKVDEKSSTLVPDPGRTDRTDDDGGKAEQLRPPSVGKAWPSLTRMVQKFVVGKQYWFAEKALEVCFWPYLELEPILAVSDIWALIEPIIHNPFGSDEGHMLGRIGILLAFCEGALYRDEARPACWTLAFSDIKKACSHMASLYPGLQSVWNRSRAATRLKLLEFDCSVGEDEFPAKYLQDTQYITVLRALEVRAADELDFQMLRCIQGRVSALQNASCLGLYEDTEHLPELFPHCIYKQHHERRDRAFKAEIAEILKRHDRSKSGVWKTVSTLSREQRTSESKAASSGFVSDSSALKATWTALVSRLKQGSPAEQNSIHSEQDFEKIVTALCDKYEERNGEGMLSIFRRAHAQMIKIACAIDIAQGLDPPDTLCGVLWSLQAEVIKATLVAKAGYQNVIGGIKRLDWLIPSINHETVQLYPTVPNVQTPLLGMFEDYIAAYRQIFLSASTSGSFPAGEDA